MYRKPLAGLEHAPAQAYFRYSRVFLFVEGFKELGHWRGCGSGEPPPSPEKTGESWSPLSWTPSRQQHRHCGRGHHHSIARLSEACLLHHSDPLARPPRSAGVEFRYRRYGWSRRVEPPPPASRLVASFISCAPLAAVLRSARHRAPFASPSRARNPCVRKI